MYGPEGFLLALSAVRCFLGRNFDHLFLDAVKVPAVVPARHSTTRQACSQLVLKIFSRKEARKIKASADAIIHLRCLCLLVGDCPQTYPASPAFDIEPRYLIYQHKMCRLSPAALPFLLGSSLCLLFARSASAALPPGYEDVMHCPPGYCRKYVNPQGMVGPTSGFNKCYNPTTDDMVDGVWTGELTDVVAPEGWVANPEDCQEEAAPVTAPVTMPGSDRDEYGCIPSAGYSWCASLSECVRPWETDCPDEEPTPVTAPVGGNDTDAGGDDGLEQYADIITDCALQIGAAATCFMTSQEPACEGFDPMSLIGGDLPIPEDCEGGVELVCAALVGCCDQKIVDIANCAAQSQGLDCDIECGGDAPTSAGSSGASTATLVLAALVATLVVPL